MIRGTASTRARLVAAVCFAVPLLTLSLSGPPAVAGTAEVTIADMAFSPPTVQVEAVEGEPGQPGLHAHVNFAMRDPGVFHTVSFDDPTVVEQHSGPLATGQTYDAVITKTGTFTYHCEIHPAMKGTVVVARASTPPATASAEQDESGSGAVGAIVLAAVGLAGLVGLVLFWRVRSTD